GSDRQEPGAGARGRRSFGRGRRGRQARDRRREDDGRRRTQGVREGDGTRHPRGRSVHQATWTRDQEPGSLAGNLNGQGPKPLDQPRYEAECPSRVACSLERERVTSCKADRSSLAQTRSSFFQGTGQETRPVVKGSGEPEPAATPAAPAVLQASSAAAPAPLPGDGAAAVPKWFPSWAR